MRSLEWFLFLFLSQKLQVHSENQKAFLLILLINLNYGTNCLPYTATLGWIKLKKTKTFASLNTHWLSSLQLSLSLVLILWHVVSLIFKVISCVCGEWDSNHIHFYHLYQISFGPRWNYKEERGKEQNHSVSLNLRGPPLPRGLRHWLARSSC